MGYDANIKSSRAVKQQRLTILFTLIGLALACTFAVHFLRRPKDGSGRLIRNKPQGNEAVAGVSGGSNNKNELLKRTIEEAAKADNKLNNLNAAELEAKAAQKVALLEQNVRAIKKTGVIMETDTESLTFTKQLQDATRTLIKLRYGDFGSISTPYRIKMDLEFQPTIPDFDTKGKEGTIVIELAPISLIPYSVYNFLEIARTWKNGAFHRNAGHVLQAIARSGVTQSMPFQEYSKEYPHKKYTIGYAGRPSGPEFYLSIQDNSQNHGPGSQQKHNPYEADCIIGRIIQGVEDGTVDRIHTMPGKEFLNDKKKWVLIRRMHILVPKGDGSDGEYVEFSSSPEVIPHD
eukprot:CAMPEP_0201693728 /NCGR_PEP_ID=MMETSP0578-20130828/6220_1 /ASSEMBLY_ACC=CAM_ASM_000663 /TAXON_ID=267565 /ORGANISM="Skeletonema grethea, Strain CCMP 1804" /LENGTH=346 /DNA_ID=CAMNT_0048179299 /DNA_START=34 /DNA_END=1074 /DNA_ORIENTATION=-